MDVTAWVIVQGLSCTLLGNRRGYTVFQFPVKCFKVTCSAGYQHTGTHRYHGIYAALNQTRCYTAEGIICRTHRALAGIQYCQLYPAVLQYLCQYTCLYQVKLALLILKSQLSLLASAPAHSILIYSFSPERPMTIEMQDMHRSFLIL